MTGWLGYNQEESGASVLCCAEPDLDIPGESRGIFGEDTVSERFGQAPDEIPDSVIIFV